MKGFFFLFFLFYFFPPSLKVLDGNNRHWKDRKRVQTAAAQIVVFFSVAMGTNREEQRSRLRPFLFLLGLFFQNDNQNNENQSFLSSKLEKRFFYAQSTIFIACNHVENKWTERNWNKKNKESLFLSLSLTSNEWLKNCCCFFYRFVGALSIEKNRIIFRQSLLYPCGIPIIHQPTDFSLNKFFGEIRRRWSLKKKEMLANIWFIYHSNFEFHSSRSSAAGCAVAFEGNRMDRKKKRGQQTNSILHLVPLLWTFNFFFFLSLSSRRVYPFNIIPVYTHIQQVSFFFFLSSHDMYNNNSRSVNGRTAATATERGRNSNLFFSGKVSSSPPIDGTIKEKCTNIQFAELKFNEAKKKKTVDKNLKSTRSTTVWWHYGVKNMKKGTTLGLERKELNKRVPLSAD